MYKPVAPTPISVEKNTLPRPVVVAGGPGTDAPYRLEPRERQVCAAEDQESHDGRVAAEAFVSGLL